MNINNVVLTGNLTRDPDRRETNGDTTIVNLRVACNGRQKDKTGSWVDKPNFFDVTVFGRQAERCYEFLRRGRQVAVNGRLDWQEWQTDSDGVVKPFV